MANSDFAPTVIEISTLLNDKFVGRWGREKVALLVKGITAVTQYCNFQLDVAKLGINKGEWLISELYEGDTQQGYGEELASLLNTVYVRHGKKPTIGLVMPYNSWSYVQDASIERLIHECAKRIKAAK